VRFGASGHDSALIGNQLTNDKDAGLWAVRSASDPHDEALAVRDNRFSADGNGVLAGNVPVLIERNEFINSNEAAVHIVGGGAIVRANHISGGASMGVLAENARDALIENNEIEGVTAYGVMVRGSASVLVRTNRLHNCGYGLAFVLDDPHRVSTALGNAILEPHFNGIDVIGDSPTLKRNEVLHAHAYALHVQDFQAPHQPRTVSKPFLEENDFGTRPSVVR
jgi:hypothetical protein